MTAALQRRAAAVVPPTSPITVTIPTASYRPRPAPASSPRGARRPPARPATRSPGRRSRLVCSGGARGARRPDDAQNATASSVRVGRRAGTKQKSRGGAAAAPAPARPRRVAMRPAVKPLWVAHDARAVVAKMTGSRSPPPPSPRPTRAGPGPRSPGRSRTEYSSAGAAGHRLAYAPGPRGEPFQLRVVGAGSRCFPRRTRRRRCARAPVA